MTYSKQLFALIVFMAVFFTGCGDEKLTEAAYIDKAKLSLDSGNYRESIIYLKNALANYPQSAEARYLLGDIYVRAGQGEGAEKELNRALELGVAKEAIIGKLGDALLMQGKYREIIDQFSLTDEDTPILKGKKLIILGDAYFQQRKLDEARSMYEKASKISSSQARAQLGLARVEALFGNKEKSIELVDAVLEDNKNSILAWLTKADVYRLANKSDEVLAAFEEAALRANSPQDYYYLVAMKGQLEQYLFQGKTEKANEVLVKLSKSFYKGSLPDVLELNHLRAVLAFQKKQYDEAAKLAEKVVKSNPNHHGATLLLGVINAENGNYEQAERNLQKFLNVRPRHVSARKILGFVQLKRNAVESAVRTLKPIKSDENLDAETLALVAVASLRAGDMNTSAKYFEKALLVEPESFKFRGGLAQSYIGMGKYDKALDEWDKIRKESSDKSMSSLAIVQTQIKAKNYKAALKELITLEQEKPDEPLYVSMQGTVYQIMKKPEKAKAFFEKAIRVRAGYPPAGRSLAFMAIEAEKLDEAEKIYSNILSENPKHFTTMYEFAQLKMRQGDFEEAKKLILAAQKLDKDKIKAAVLLARIYLQQQKASQAISQLREVVLPDGRVSPAILAEQGNAQMMLGEYNNALDSFKKLADIQKDMATSYYLIFTAHVALRDKEEANKALNQSLSKDPQFLPALVAKVKMLLADNKLVDAKQWIDKVKEVAPDSGSLSILKAELAMRNNKPLKAIELYSSLYERLPTPEVTHKLAQAYWASGNKTQAFKVLTTEANKQPNNSQLHYVLGTAFDLIGEKEKAIAAYRKAIQLNDQHVMALNNLAWLLKDTDKKEALTFAQKALELAPQNKDVQDTIEQIRKR